jgi:ribosomal protein S12 methylthiotransferase
MGVFTYSLEPDTPAANLPDHVPAEIAESRRERLMLVQQEIAFAALEAQLGRTLDVIIDQPVPDEKNVWIGRGAADAPDVDGLVFVTGNHIRLRAGDIVPCEVVATQEYDLVAAAAGKPRPAAKPNIQLAAIGGV